MTIKPIKKQGMPLTTHPWKRAALLLLGTLIVALQLQAIESSHPNIVVILSDDYGYGSANCYGADNNLIKTPNIDRLAREGRRFTDANTSSSVCSPSRYSLLTGRYCWRTSLKHEVLGTTSPLHIEPGRLNLASLLKTAGYSTAAIGKWHLGYGNRPKTDFTLPLKPGPLEIGFDYHFGVPANHGDIAGVYVENHAVFGLRSTRINQENPGTNFVNKPFLGLDAPLRVDEEVMPFITAKAVDWIEAQSERQPFFLYYTPVAVHSPITPSAATQGTSRAGVYGDWIHELDSSVGRVLDALDRKGFSENTLVLFTSDNGGVNKPGQAAESTDAIASGLKVSGSFRGGKHDVWEGGFRVPYILRWPGHIPADSLCNETLGLVDTLATVAALIGKPLPAAQMAAEDSYNMLPAWLAEKTAAPIRPDIILHSAAGNFAIRRGAWKWIEGGFHPDTRQGSLRQLADQFKKQLYNLEEDAAESKDIQSSHPELSRELETLLNRYRDGGYSRMMPPPSPPSRKEPPPGAITGKIIRSEKFDQLPEAPVVVVRGRWNASAGVLRGSQKGGDRIGAALRVPLNFTNGDLQYKIACPIDASHTLRVQSSRSNLIFLISISPRWVTIIKQETEEGRTTGKKTVAEEKLDLTPGEWSDVRVQFLNDEITVQVDDTVARAEDPSFEIEKKVVALMVNGREISFKNLTVYSSDAN